MLGYFHQRTETNNINFYAPVKKNCLRTFEKEKNTVKLNVLNQKVATRVNWGTFARLLLIQQKYKVNLKEVLAYELGSLSLYPIMTEHWGKLRSQNYFNI